MKNKRIKSGIIIIVFAFMLVLSLFAGQGVTPAFADTSNFSSLIKDLSADPNFNFADYPEKSDDYSIQVIQIAESKQGNLFLYAYQPCQNTFPLVATEINMSLSESVDGTEPYGLKQVSTWGVFAKYLVEGVTVSSDNVRYYNVTSIYRDYIEGVDEPPVGDNIKDTVCFPVGKCFKVSIENGNLKYECKEKETIEIINPYHDFLEYPNGFKFFPQWCHSHYICFSTDRLIDDLLEVDVSYDYKNYEGICGGSPEGEPETTIKTIDYLQTGQSKDGWFSDIRTWDRIEKSEDFIKNETLNSATKDIVSKSEWVIRFVETPYKKTVLPGTFGQVWGEEKVVVSNVRVLRLMFRFNGKVYNLGAISDGVSGDDKPGNKPDSVGFWRYIWNCIVKLFKGTASLTEQIVAVIALFLVLLAFPILLTVLSLVFPAFGAVMKTILKAVVTAVKYLFIGLWYLISAPFRFIAWLVRKCRGE